MSDHAIFGEFAVLLIVVLAYFLFAKARQLDGLYNSAWRIVRHATVSLSFIWFFVLMAPDQRSRLVVAAITAVLGAWFWALAYRRQFRAEREIAEFGQTYRQDLDEAYEAGRREGWQERETASRHHVLEGEILPPTGRQPSPSLISSQPWEQDHVRAGNGSETADDSDFDGARRDAFQRLFAARH